LLFGLHHISSEQCRQQHWQKLETKTYQRSHGKKMRTNCHCIRLQNNYLYKHTNLLGQKISLLICGTNNGQGGDGDWFLYSLSLSDIITSSNALFIREIDFSKKGMENEW
jgi:hypothetical protein